MESQHHWPLAPFFSHPCCTRDLFDAAEARLQAAAPESYEDWGSNGKNGKGLSHIRENVGNFSLTFSIQESMKWKAGKVLLYLSKHNLMLVYSTRICTYLYTYMYIRMLPHMFPYRHMYGHVRFFCTYRLCMSSTWLLGSFSLGRLSKWSWCEPVATEPTEAAVANLQVEAERWCTMHSIKDPHGSVFAICSIQTSTALSADFCAPLI